MAEKRGLRPLLHIADEGQALAHALGGGLHNIPIPEFHLQQLRKPLSHRAPQSAEFPGNGDDILLHIAPPLAARTGLADFFCIRRTIRDSE